MNDNARAWVAALRSGKYKQGRDMLRNANDEYCCLGVACELAIEAGLGITRSLSLKQGGYVYSNSVALLPFAVQEWLGLASFDGAYRKKRSLVCDNDERKLTFAQIADIIESEPSGLFVEEPCV